MRRAGGANCDGEPNFRVVLGRITAHMDRRTLDGSRCERKLARGTHRMRRVPKYLPIERWHVERWMPPESYGRRNSGTNKRRRLRTEYG